MWPYTDASTRTRPRIAAYGKFFLASVDDSGGRSWGTAIHANVKLILMSFSAAGLGAQRLFNDKNVWSRILFLFVFCSACWHAAVH